jgi:hypothetical protein
VHRQRDDEEHRLVAEEAAGIGQCRPDDDEERRRGSSKPSYGLVSLAAVSVSRIQQNMHVHIIMPLCVTFTTNARHFEHVHHVHHVQYSG